MKLSIFKTTAGNTETVDREIQGLESDPVGFGDKFRIAYPSQWEKIDWRHVYPGAKFVVNTNFTLKQTGLFR